MGCGPRFFYDTSAQYSENSRNAVESSTRNQIVSSSREDFDPFIPSSSLKAALLGGFFLCKTKNAAPEYIRLRAAACLSSGPAG